MTTRTFVILGLSLTSSWGNGHATTWRALVRGLRAEGHRVLFLERDVPWYAEHRDLPDPDFCDFALYSDLDDLTRFIPEIHNADVALVGSFVPQGAQVIDLVAKCGAGALAFYDIDTPVTLARLDSGQQDYLQTRQIAGFDVYFSFSGGDVLHRLEQQYNARWAVPLFCSVDETRYHPTGEDFDWDLGYLGTYSPDRQPLIDQLLLEPARQLPDRRFVVAGPQYPDTIRWPSNVERIDHLPPSEHPSFYSRQRFTLNVTRADMRAAGWSPSVRLFEAAACGTPIISDRWKGLSELLPEGRSITIADTSDDVIRAVARLSEMDRRAMARSARRRVLASHTGRARARELVAAVDAAIAIRERFSTSDRLHHRRRA